MNLSDKIQKYWDVGEYVRELGAIDKSPDETITLIETKQGKFAYVETDYVDTNPVHYDWMLKDKGLQFDHFVKLREEFIPVESIVHPSVDYYDPDELEQTRTFTLTAPDSFMREVLVAYKNL